MQVITKRKSADTIPVKDVPAAAVYTYGPGHYHYLRSNNKYSVCLQDGHVIDVSHGTLKVRILEGVFHAED